MNGKQIAEMIMRLEREKAEIEGQLKEIKNRLFEAEKALMDWMVEQGGIDQIRVGNRTFYRYVADVYNIQDKDAFIHHILEHGDIHLLQTRLATRAVREVYEDTGELPPGVERIEITKLGRSTTT